MTKHDIEYRYRIGWGGKPCKSVSYGKLFVLLGTVYARMFVFSGTSDCPDGSRDLSYGEQGFVLAGCLYKDKVCLNGRFYGQCLS